MIGDEHTELSWFTLETAVALPDLALEEYRALFRKLADAKSGVSLEPHGCSWYLPGRGQCWL